MPSTPQANGEPPKTHHAVQKVSPLHLPRGIEALDAIGCDDAVVEQLEVDTALTRRVGRGAVGKGGSGEGGGY